MDERIRIDEIPNSRELEEWAADREPTHDLRWQKVVMDFGTAVSLNLVDSYEMGTGVAEPPAEFEPTPIHDGVYWRRPRSAELRVWKARRLQAGGYELSLTEVQRLLVAFPGNEKVLPLESYDDTTMAVSVTFNGKGALTKITTETTGADQQRNTDVASMLTGAKDAAEAGAAFTKALSPPSLVDQAAAAEAAEKLAPSTEDPDVKLLKEQIAQAQLRARLRVAQQLAEADSPPVVVRIDAALA